MSPQNMVHVVEVAWLLVALVFRQQDVCAAALQVSRRQQGCSDSLLHIMCVLCLQRPLLSAGIHTHTKIHANKEACADLRKRLHRC